MALFNNENRAEISQAVRERGSERAAYHKLPSQEVTRTSPKALGNANIWTYLQCKDAAVAIPSSESAWWKIQD